MAGGSSSPDELIQLFQNGSPVLEEIKRYDFIHTFSDEQRLTYELGIVDLFLFRSSGNFILQQRSFKKRNNPGKLHTTVGRVVSFGDSFDQALIRESEEEAGISPIITSNTETLLSKLQKDSTSAYTIPIHQYNRDAEQSRGNERIKMREVCAFYAGVYDGKVHCDTDEVAGWKEIPWSEFLQEVHTADQYTDPLKEYIRLLEEPLTNFVRAITEK